MSAMTPAYQIVSRVHVNKWDERLQQAVSGWEVKAYVPVNGVIIPVFLPDTVFTPENLDTLIRREMEVHEQIDKLGG